MSSLTSAVQAFKHALVGLLPAQPCLLCGAMSRHGVWCEACNAALPHVSDSRCPICALPSPQNQICGQCLRQPPPFELTVSAFDYVFPLNKLIQAFKFSQQLPLAQQLADALDRRIQLLPDAIIPMPLHPLRLRERGFNQSLLLAQRLAARRHLPLLNNVCQRIRHTTPQSTLAWKERGKNMRKAFECSGEVSGKHIAVVDDVMTSGASMVAVAECLRQAGAVKVSAWVVARTLQRKILFRSDFL